MDEFNLIATYFKHLTVANADTVLGVGDDAAILKPSPNMAIAVAADTLVLGRHFTEQTTAHAIGYKSLAVNLSDLAAMGAKPKWFTLCLTLPEPDNAWLSEFTRGVYDCAREFKVDLVGGDTTKGPLTVSVQVIGEQSADSVMTRRGAAPGDLVYVSGNLGLPALTVEQANFAASNKLNYPSARVALGQRLATLATSCIDISDGLAQDLGHILDSSEVGVELELDALPVHPDVLEALPETEAKRFALHGGDEYELCFTVPEDKTSQFKALCLELGIVLTRIGRITSAPDRWLKLVDDSQEKLTSEGYTHF